MRDLVQVATPTSKRPAASTVFWIAAVAVVVALLFQGDEHPARPAAWSSENPRSIPAADAASGGCSPGRPSGSKEMKVMSAIPDPDHRTRPVTSNADPGRVETATFAMG